MDSNDLANNGYSFGNSREDVEDLMRVITNSDEDIRLTRLALEGLQKCKFPKIDEEISKFAKDVINYNEFSFIIFYERGLIPADDSHWLELIKNGNPIVAQIAVELLSNSKLQSSAFQELLWNKLKDKKTGYYLQSACFNRLSESPTKEFLIYLIDSLNNRSFRQTALEMLEKITGQKLDLIHFVGKYGWNEMLVLLPRLYHNRLRVFGLLMNSNSRTSPIIQNDIGTNLRAIILKR